ncbi:MAG: SDR family NAD(P)-dependent oxidoreductase [Pseudomonadota bacterium]|uniref:SDR family NAD(P)-dependent oxidoreductase n=1 Tax=Rhizorhabdus phycosphaerae TaxID=2711156 RepID=UPI0013EDF979|nr:SDR family oxidoreductase [Rhizorhabdus phycosphaerae]
MKLAGRVAIVTGAASGIGAAIAARFAAEGAQVLAADIEPRKPDEGTDRIFPFPCDVTDPDAVDALVADALARFERLDIMVNNVGAAVHGWLKDAGNDDWDRAISISLSSTFYGIRAALRPMLRQQSGSIINISSGAGFGGAPGMASYGTAKAGVHNLTRSAAVENARSGVRINCIAPGAIESPPIVAWANTLQGGLDAYVDGLLPGRFGRPEEIAAVALFLATDEASFVNGAVIPVDGAASARMAAIAVPSWDS